MPKTGVALNPEWTLLLTACSATPPPEKIPALRALLKETPRWYALLTMADRHGVQPPLYQALSAVRSEDEQAVPAEAFLASQRAYQANLHKALLLSRELIRILDHLTALGIEGMPYKGLALAEALYGDIAFRQTGDIDLLIHPHDLSRIRDAAGSLGYTPHLNFSNIQERAYLKSGYEYAFDGAAGPNLLEVQWAIQPRFYAIDFDMDGLFQRGVMLTVAGHNMKTPSPEDLFLVLSVHAAKHAWARLVWLCDTARLMKLPNLNWEWIGSQARELGVVRILRVSMLLANRLLGAVTPAAAQSCLPQDSAALGLSQEIENYIAGESAFNTESAAYFDLMMSLRERGTDRLRFLQRLVLTPGPSEWNAVRLPAPLFPLYRLVRLSRLAARIVRPRDVS